MNKSGKHRTRSDGKADRAKKQQARQDKQQQKKRTRRGKSFKLASDMTDFSDFEEEVEEDESLSEVVDMTAQEELDSIYEDLTGQLTEEKLKGKVKRFVAVLTVVSRRFFESLFLIIFSCP